MINSANSISVSQSKHTENMRIMFHSGALHTFLCILHAARWQSCEQ